MTGASRAATAVLTVFGAVVAAVLSLIAPGFATGAPGSPQPAPPTAVPVTSPSPSCVITCLPRPTKTAAPPTTPPATHHPAAAPTTRPPVSKAAAPITQAPQPVATGGGAGTDTGPTNLPNIQIGAVQPGSGSVAKTRTGRTAAESSDPLVRDLVLALAIGVLLGVGGAGGLFLTRDRPGPTVGP